MLVSIASCSSASAPKRSSGPDLSGVDAAVRPQDDLYRHVNGAWLREFRLPADKPSYGVFDELTDRTEERLREILEGMSGAAAGTDEQRLHAVYTGCLDTAARERAGISPLADLLAEIDNAAGKPELARVMGRLTALGVPGLIGVRVQPDRKDPTRHRVYLSQSGLGMPDGSFYRDTRYADQQVAYRTYLERIGRAAGLPEPTGLATRTYELENGIAGGHVDLTLFIEAMSSYNPYSWSGLRELAPGFDWDAWLAGVTDRPERFETVVVDQPGYLPVAARLWAETDIAVWRDYLRLRVISRYAPALSTAFAEAHFDWNDRTLQGTQQPPERWRTAVRVVRERLGDALGRAYAARHFPAESKKLADELVSDLLRAYRTALGEASWMSEATRQTAVAKVDKVVAMVGAPSRGRDYTGLAIPGGDFVAALRAADRFEFQWQLRKLERPVDRGEWDFMTPADVNASYSWELNHICLPAAILQPPFFDPDADAAVNYGGIGMVIAHEMGHGFDTGGSKYDANGVLRDWWTPEDKAAFEAKAQLVVDQYDPLVPEGMSPDQHVDGALTVTENLADLRGLTTALAAYRLAEQRRGVTNPDYRPLFQAYARIWRHCASPEYQAMMLGLDPHSPAEFRVNQVARNMPEFYTAFDVQPADRMYLEARKRVTM
ncbi:putative endopeptidase [Nocardia amikacinitolerans]|uniref:Putative endopeptidase n=1 Tax=Nocardia amikacinitolerans TaxID=756689 RepID=A0A285L218_9NOCA|nr:putative endopeptidase [Nocardia amikacinitolerans]